MHAASEWHDAIRELAILHIEHVCPERLFLFLTCSCSLDYRMCRDMSTEFCPQCGNHTMVRVSVWVDEEGVSHYRQPNKFIYNNRGKIVSDSVRQSVVAHMRRPRNTCVTYNYLISLACISTPFPRRKVVATAQTLSSAPIKCRRCIRSAKKVSTIVDHFFWQFIPCIDW